MKKEWNVEWHKNQIYSNLTIHIWPKFKLKTTIKYFADVPLYILYIHTLQYKLTDYDHIQNSSGTIHSMGKLRDFSRLTLIVYDFSPVC